MKERLAERLRRLRALLAEKNLDGLWLYGRENTRYFCGFSGSTSLALLTAERAFVWVDSRYTEQARAECPCCELVQPEGSLLAALAQQIGADGLRRVGVEDACLSLALAEALREQRPDVELCGVSAAVDRLRWVKDAFELEAIKQAIWIADEAFALTLPHIKAGMRELEVAALLEFNMKKLGSTTPSFETICASGWRAALPHGHASEKRLAEGEVVVLDFGATYQGYCSDITRSFFIGKADEKLAEIYRLVLRAQLHSEAEIRAGMQGREAHQLAASVIAEGGYGDYFGHGLGHSLGLAVHESPSFNARSEDVVPVGALMTVEPGVYLPGLGGVRIEDIVWVKDEGVEVLTQATKDLLIL